MRCFALWPSIDLVGGQIDPEHQAEPQAIDARVVDRRRDRVDAGAPAIRAIGQVREPMR